MIKDEVELLLLETSPQLRNLSDPVDAEKAVNHLINDIQALKPENRYLALSKFSRVFNSPSRSTWVNWWNKRIENQFKGGIKLREKVVIVDAVKTQRWMRERSKLDLTRRNPLPDVSNEVRLNALRWVNNSIKFHDAAQFFLNELGGEFMPLKDWPFQEHVSRATIYRMVKDSEEFARECTKETAAGVMISPAAVFGRDWSI